MHLTVFINKPEIRIEVSEKDILTCYNHDELLSMLQNKVKQVLTSPKHFRVVAEHILSISNFYHSNRPNVVKDMFVFNHEEDIH